MTDLTNIIPLSTRTDNALAKLATLLKDVKNSYLPLSGGTLTNDLTLTRASGEGGQINIRPAQSETAQSGITLDNYNSTFRIFGIPSADGTTKTGTGTVLAIDPYNKTITGGYTITGNLIGAGDIVKNTSDTSWTGVSGGTDYRNGANLLLYGKNHTSSAGIFQLQAMGTSGVSLLGKPDGSLSWGGDSFHLGGANCYIGTNSDTLAAHIRTKGDSNYALELYAGSAWNSGPSLSLYPTNSTHNSKGGFALRSGAAAYYLRGTPAGALSWNGTFTNSGAVTVNSSVTVNGSSYLHGGIYRYYTAFTKGSNPSATIWPMDWIVFDSTKASSGGRLHEIRGYVDANGQTGVQMLAFQNTSAGTAFGYISINKKADGTNVSYVHTPPVTDDSTQIATTAFVKDVTATRISNTSRITLDSVSNNTSTSWITERTVTPTYNCWVYLYLSGGVSGVTTRAGHITSQGIAARNAEYGSGRDFAVGPVFIPANTAIAWASVMCTNSILYALRAY